MTKLKFDRYQLVREQNSLEIRDSLLGTGVYFCPFIADRTDEAYQSEVEFSENYVARLNACQDLTTAQEWEEHLGFVLGPRSNTAIRINTYKEKSPFDTKPKIRLAMLHRILIEYEKEDQGHYQLMEQCDLDLTELEQLIAKLQAAKRLLAPS